MLHLSLLGGLSPRICELPALTPARASQKQSDATPLQNQALRSFSPWNNLLRGAVDTRNKGTNPPKLPRTRRINPSTVPPLGREGSTRGPEYASRCRRSL